MKLSNHGEKFLQEREGLRLLAYLDGAGIWTIGYGHTGPEITRNTVWSFQQAEDAFEKDTDWAERCINENVRVPLKQCQFDALVSFVYNIGATRFLSSTLRRKLNAKDYEGAAKEFRKWNKKTDPKTKRLVVDKGLDNRRILETNFFNSES